MVRWPIHLVLFLVALVGYGYFYQGGGWNQNSRFDLTRALVERSSLEITPYAANTGDLARRDTRYYCDKAPMASLLAVPAYAAFLQLQNAQLGAPAAHQLDDAAYWATWFAVGLPAAIFLCVLFELLLLVGLAPRRALALTALYGFATPAWPYATMLYGHQLLGVFGGAAFAWLWHLRHAPTPPARAQLIGVGVVLGCAAATEYTAAFIMIACAGYAWLWLRPQRWLGWLTLGALPPLLALAWYQHAAFGSPWALPYDYSTQPHRGMGFFMGLGAPSGAALWGISLSPYRGLLFMSPWLVWAVPGLVQGVRRASTRRESVVAAAVIGLFVWMNASLVDWQGGWAIGARYLVPTLPFWTVLAAIALRKARPWRDALATMLGVASFGLTLFATAVQPQAPSHLGNPWSQLIFPNLFRNALALTNQGIDEKTAEGAPMAWNLGQHLGLTGTLSLLPLLLVMTAAAWFLAWHTSPRRTPS